MLLKLFFVLGLLRLVVSTPVNLDVQRTIDASKAIVRIFCDIKVGNFKSNDHYELLFPKNASAQLAFLSIEIGEDGIFLPEPKMDGEYLRYSVYPQIINPRLKITAVMTSALVPRPAEIKQLETQYVQLFDSHYFLSPYHTVQQSLNIKLSSATIESFSKLEPFSKRGTTISFGPFKEVAAYEVSPLVVHFANNKPFAKFSSVVREVEVSHWGRVSFEDVYELRHAGAKLKGGFSRFDHQMRRNTETASFSHLYAKLPRTAEDLYYRDQIGNISTSDLFFEHDHIALDVGMRFPVFGGWQSQFYIGYSLPTESVLYYDMDKRKYFLRIDFFTIFEDVWVEEQEIKVVLPEGCSDVSLEVPYAYDRKDRIRFTYLDSELNGGRKVLIISAKNLVEEHDGEIVVSYAFSRTRMLVEPLMLFASFFAFFVICSIISRQTLNLGGRKYKVKEA